MRSDKRHLQLRLSKKMRKEVEDASRKLGMSASDVVRGSLFFGLPIFSAAAGLQVDLHKRLVAVLKRQARK